MSVNPKFIDNRMPVMLSKPAITERLAPVEVLQELFLLLEEFGPQWYTEEQHNRAVAALTIGLG